MTRKFGWTKNVLIHQIEGRVYEESLPGQTNFERAFDAGVAGAGLAVRDEYIFDFLELREAHSERELERGILGRMEDFLRGMGGMFAFVDSQFQPEFVGKMQFYLAALDSQAREEEENSDVGIILCKEKNRTVVEYALRDARKPIGVAPYRVVKRLPKELRE